MWRRLLEFLLLGFFAAPIQAYEGPVFLWGIDGPSQPALQLVTQQEFADDLSSLKREYMFVVFVDTHLDSTDFACFNETTKEFCLRKLKAIKNFRYYSQVISPLKALLSLTSTVYPHFANAVNPNYMVCNAGTVHTIYMTGVQHQDRAYTLTAHDNLMATITEKLDLCPTIFVYLSGDIPPVPSRISPRRRPILRTMADAQKQNGFRQKADRFSLSFSAISATFDGTVQSLNVDGWSVESKDTKISVTLKLTDGGGDLVFDVNLLVGYYGIQHVQYKNLRFIASDMILPYHFSYACAEVQLSHGKQRLRWKNLQFEVYPKAIVDAKDAPFSEPWHCSSFMTPAILAGLFTMALIIGIEAVGICWIMDMNACDRLDDPNKRTITILAHD